MSIRQAVTAATLLTLGACATRAETRAPQTAEVPAGTPFVATLDDSVGTAISTPGERFSMHLDTPLRAADGTVVVPANAVIIGRVASAQAGVHPTLRFDNVALLTSTGAQPVQVSIRNPDVTARGDGHELSMMPPPVPRVQPATTPSTVASTTVSPGSQGATPGAAPTTPPVQAPYVEAPVTSIGGGPSPARQPAGADIVVPVGTQLSLVLDAPLEGIPAPVSVEPGNTVSR